MDIETKYGTFNVAFMLIRDNETPQKIKCPHDTDKYGYFTCHKKDGEEGTEFQSKLECINSPKSKEYESIADEVSCRLRFRHKKFSTVLSIVRRLDEALRHCPKVICK